jgi:hypothetical protein
MNNQTNEVMEHYSWVDELLEKKYYDYAVFEDEYDDRDYETFGYGEDERYAWVDKLLEKKYYDYVNVEDEKDDCETFVDDYDLLVSDLKNLISYHEDRRQRRAKQTDDVFALFNQMTAHI